jgi:hypothetical protein
VRDQFTNPYWAIIAVPLAIFMALVHFDTDPDYINLWGRAAVFTLLGYIAARYVGRAPFLMWSRNFSPEARNIVGWAICLVGFMLQIAYGWVYIAYDRPLWLSSQYWGASFVVLVGVGLAVVASSVPRLPPFGNDRNGLSELASLAVVALSTLSVFVVSHIPQIMAFIKSVFGGIARAF